METGKDQTVKASTLLGVMGSVLSGMFGVQNNKTREKDFTQGKPSHFIIIALIMTGVFVLAIWGMVSLVMKLSGV